MVWQKRRPASGKPKKPRRKKLNSEPLPIDRRSAAAGEEVEERLDHLRETKHL